VISLRISLVLLLLAAACNREPEAAATTPTPEGPRADTALVSAEGVRIAGFTTAPVQRSVWHETWSVPARITLDPSATEPLGSIVEGRVVKVYASPGDRVKRSQVLVAIHSHEIMDARASLGRAKATMSHAESDSRVVTSAADRAERLYTIKALSLADLEHARGNRIDAMAALDAARYELERADAFLDHLVGDGPLPDDYDEHWVLIRAPMDGQVVSRDVLPGNVVLVGAPLITVSRLSQLVLVMQLPEAAAAQITTGASVQFTVAAHKTRPFNARVSRVLPSIDTMSRTVEVHAAVVNANGLLKAEMFAQAEIDGPASGATNSVPAAALQSLDGESVVITARKLGEALQMEVVKVRVGRRTRERVEILAGLDSTQIVINDGASIAKAELVKRRGGG